MTWQHDFFEIALDPVPMPELDPTWAVSKSYQREQQERWILDLSEVQRRMREEGWRPEDFERIRQSSNASERTLGETYHKFYHHDSGGDRLNHDFVKVDWVGNHYEITNGQHRIWLAKQHGLRTMPAHVSAPDQATLNRLRTDGERAAHSTRQEAPTERKPLWERGTSDQRERESSRCRER